MSTRRSRWGASGHDGAPRTAEQRRRGPAGEPRWWDPVDQAWAEDLPLARRVFGRGWLDVPMVNNAERADPFTGTAAEAVLAARAARQVTALDEGRAWRRRDGALAVLRVEVYASADDAAHRSAWRGAAEACLEQTWRARWRERGCEPGWVEATWVPPADRPDPLRLIDAVEAAADSVAARVDWLRLEDHTEAAEQDAVTAYEQVVVWLGRGQATLTLRHLLGTDLDDVVVAAATTLARAAPPPTEP